MPPSSERDFDILIVGDFRFAGGTSAAIAEEVRFNARAGYRTGLLHRRADILGGEPPLSAKISGLVEQGLARFVDGFAPLRVGLLALHNPHVFTQPVTPVPPVVADAAILVAHQPPLDGLGNPFYDVFEAHRNATAAFGAVRWAPVSPLVRRQLLAVAPDLPLLDTDWVNVIDPAEWALPPPPPTSKGLVIGRHSRPHPQKWPDTREEALKAWPDTPDIEVQVLGGGPYLAELYGPLPANWKVTEFDGTAVRDFLGRLHAYVYFHGSRWVEAFGRTTLEALAAGLPCVLPPHFREIFGDAPIYTELDGVAEILHRLRAEPAWRAECARRGRRFAEERHGPKVHLDRLHGLIGAPTPLPRHTRSGRSPRERVMLVSSNGIGMGHLTRLLSIARRLEADLTPVFVTMSQAMSVVHRFDCLAEFIPFHAYLESDPGRWNEHLYRELDAKLDFYRPRVLVFDGNMPYSGLVRTAQNWPDTRFVWLRRAMWPANAPTTALERSLHFDLVIEPRDIAEIRDTGPTVRLRRRTLRVNPLMLLDPSELLPRNEARQKLGIGKDDFAVLVQLGSGNNLDIMPVVERVLRDLDGRPGISLRFVEWPISNLRMSFLPERLKLREYPVARLLAGFDAAISAAGYNSFHELVSNGIPTLFIPNTAPGMDNQLARAEYARDRGAGLVMRATDTEDLPRLLDLLTDARHRASMQRRCRSLACPNGAAEAAAAIGRLAGSARRAAQEPPFRSAAE